MYKKSTCHPEKDAYCKGLCKACYSKQWYWENRDKLLVQKREWWKNNIEVYRSYGRKWKYIHKEQVNESRKIYREQNAVLLLDKHRKYNDKNRELINKKNRLYISTHPKERRELHLINRYNLPSKKYQEMFETQGGVCAICGKPGGNKRLCVDHNHETGKIRGLICDSCNVGIGRLKDDPVLVEKALKYLLKHESET